MRRPPSMPPHAASPHSRLSPMSPRPPGPSFLLCPPVSLIACRRLVLASSTQCTYSELQARSSLPSLAKFLPHDKDMFPLVFSLSPSRLLSDHHLIGLRENNCTSANRNTPSLYEYYILNVIKQEMQMFSTFSIHKTWCMSQF